MNLKNIQNLQQFALNHKVAPSDTAWFRLANKLEHSNNQRKIKFYKYFSYAAVMIAMVAVISYFKSESEMVNQVVHTSDLYQNQITELKESENQGIYDVSKLQELRIAYRKLNIKVNL